MAMSCGCLDYCSRFFVAGRVKEFLFYLSNWVGGPLPLPESFEIRAALLAVISPIGMELLTL